MLLQKGFRLILKRVFCYVPALAPLSFLNVELGIAACQSSRCYFIKKLINIFVKQTKQKRMLLQKGFHLTVERVFSMWSWAELLVSHLVVIDFTLQTQRQSFLLCFHHYCVDRGTSLFDVSQCHICFCFFLFVFDDPVTSNRHKKIFVYMISAVQNC